jgi:hypothetical protein
MQLHSALSYCTVRERAVFLDLDRDRYFCLAGELEIAWKAWVGGSAGPDAAERLVRYGLVVPGAGPAIEACPNAIAPISLLDGPPSSVSLQRMIALAAIQAQMRRTLRRRGLGQAAAALETARRRSSRRLSRPALPAIARDCERLGLVTSTHDLCLPRSLALGHYLARCGYEPAVVLGVRLGPFRAHCWVECEGDLVNDRFERVRHYTPIRRL